MLLSSPSQLEYVPKKIISLVPSQTELLHYLGLEKETIGITKFCIHPHQWFITKTRVGGTKSVKIKKIFWLNPDLVIANKEENNKEDIEAIAEIFPVWVTDIQNLEDAIKMIKDIGILTAKEPEGGTLVHHLEKIFSLHSREFKFNQRPVIYLIWKEPYMTVGGDTFINSMIKAAGYVNVYNHLKRYPIITMDELRHSPAEIIMLSSEPYPFKEKHLEVIKAGAPGKKVVLVDGEMFSWYGSRLMHAPEYFKKLMETIAAI